jgi:hypothetical protein
MDVPTLHSTNDGDTMDEISSSHIENAPMSPDSSPIGDDDHIREDTASGVNGK